MALLKVAHLGHPVLRQTAEQISRKALRTAEVQRFIDDLTETMREYDGVGLAAPQVHESVRIVVYEIAANPRYPEAPGVPLTILVNPVITPACEDLVEDWEGCLSLPDLRGKVPRYSAVQVEALDRRGKPIAYLAKDFHARVIQHECDHLDGRVFLDRMTDMSTLHFLPEFLRYADGEDHDNDGSAEDE